MGAVPAGLRALLVLRASTWACLLCFTTYTERVGICRLFGAQGPEIDQCEEAFTAAFQGLSDMEINYEERSHLHDTFTQMTMSLQEEAAAQGSFEVAFPAAAEKMKRAILQLKKVQPCVPPCGIQEVTRSFRCTGCYSTVCDLPLDCPGPVLLRGGLPAAGGGDNLLLELRGRSPDSGRVLLPRLAAGPRVPGAHPAGAAHAPRDFLLRDPARPAPPGAAVLLPERDRPAPARGDPAAGHVPGSAALGAAGRGNGRALEAQPGRAAGPARCSDAGQPGPAGRCHRLSIRLCDGAGVDVLPVVLEWRLTKVPPPHPVFIPEIKEYISALGSSASEADLADSGQ
ncbi:PREDICTED: uncharacterized protein LOC102004982 isoform X1 [Chinchilla lanigera]|uniref:uncharacterized protein LOC102004982 isoform X1 n=1 Tax=Chinchilla lanigera TaxID=34839 RepID=UPI000696B59D|nr:PREDICTED: uncharacterized protein LOC102004982 isoform X1 [Chinchilla lanigera]